MTDKDTSPTDITPLDFKLIFYEHLQEDGIYSFDAQLIETNEHKDITITDVKVRTLTDPKKIFDWKIGKIYMLPVKKHTKLPGVYMLLLKWKELVHEYLKDEEANPMKAIPTTDIIPSVSDDKPITKDSNLDVSVRGSQSLTETTYQGEVIDYVSNLPSEQEITEYYERYKFVKKAIIDKTDIQFIGTRSFLKKSGFRKFIQAFKLSLEILDKCMSVGDKGLEFEVVVRCTAPNGQFVDAVAICQQFEKKGNRSKHDTLATATTRAKNRAISDLVAFGEVSAEEMN